MSPLLLATGVLVVAGGLAAVALQDPRQRTIGLAVAVIFAPYAMDPALPLGALAVCVLAGALAAYLAWTIADPESPIVAGLLRIPSRAQRVGASGETGGSSETPADLATPDPSGPVTLGPALAALELPGVFVALDRRAPAAGMIVRRILLPDLRIALPAFSAGAAIAFAIGLAISISGADESGSGFAGPAGDLAAGLALLAVAAPGLAVERRPEPFARSLLLFLVGGFLARTGFAGTPGTVEALTEAAVMVLASGAVVLIARRASEPAADAHMQLWPTGETARITVSPAVGRVALPSGLRGLGSTISRVRGTQPAQPEKAARHAAGTAAAGGARHRRSSSCATRPRH